MRVIRRKATPVERLLKMSIADARCDRTFPAGTIGVVSADLARYASFTMALCGVKHPYGTTITWQRGCDLIGNFNKLVESMQGDWLWFMGDDHVFEPNTLVRLLSRMYIEQCDLVAPLVLGRQPPFPTVIGTLNATTKTIQTKLLQDCKGLMSVDVVGSAGLLVRRHVFEKIGSPWFEAGCITRTGLGEDWWFCLKAKKAGFQVYVDADIPMGHTTSMTVWPSRGDEQAGARLVLDEKHVVCVQHVVAPAEAAA